MSYKNLYILALAALLLIAMFCTTGCHGDHSHDDGHSHGPGGHSHGPGGDHDDHAHDDDNEDLTINGERLQLFVEYAPLVTGDTSEFAVHLTRREDHTPIRDGQVTIELTGDAPTERFSASTPRSPGIFVVNVKPTHPGPRQATIRWTSEDLTETFDLGRLIAFASPEGARSAALSRAAQEEEGPAADPITFLLEQQWFIPFRLDEVQTREVRPTLSAMGRLALPPQAQTIITAPRDGRLVSLAGRFPQVGDAVEAGSGVLAIDAVPTADADPATLDLASERAALRVDATRREVERLRPLAAQGVVPTRRLDEAQSALNEALAEQRSAQRRLASLGQSQRIGRAASDALRIPTPITGTVVELFATSGTWVAEGTPIARIVDSSELWLDVAVPESYVARLIDVSGAWFELDGYEGVFEVTKDMLLSRAPEIDPVTRTLTVRFAMENLGQSLVAGFTPRVHLIVAPPRQSVTVPFSAIVDDAGIPVVYTQLSGESFARRPVRLDVRDGAHVEVLAGVDPGDWVVARGAYSVKLAASSSDDIGHGHAH